MFDRLLWKLAVFGENEENRKKVKIFQKIC